MSHFSSQGYGILACDLLGFGQSSRSEDPSMYRLQPVSNDLTELLDHVGLAQVIGVGHDIGATILSRLASYHPQRFIALVFLAVGPPRLGTPFDLNAINDTTRRMMGYELLGYINWLTEGAQNVLEQNSASAMSLTFAENSVSVWQQWFHPLHKMEEFVTQDRRVRMGTWYTTDLQKEHLAAFHRQGGYTGCQWYRMWRDNLFAADERGFEAVILPQPCLLIIPNGSEPQVDMLAEWAPTLTVTRLESGHWVHLEESGGTSSAIAGFLNKLKQEPQSHSG